MRELQVTKVEEGEKLIRFLSKHLKEASNGFLYKMLRKKNITLNNKKASGNEILKDKDLVKVFFSEETFLKMSGEQSAVPFLVLNEVELKDIEDRILYEDSDYILINKKAGELSQKASQEDISINEKLISYLLQKGEYSKDLLSHFHPSVINRLDRNTSGVLLFGKSMKGLQDGGLLMKTHEGNKLYHCVVYKEKGFPFDQNESTIEGFLIKDEGLNQVVYQKESSNPNALTMKQTVRVLKDAGDFALLEVTLYTGRSHQIRASLKAYHAPVLLDPKYGNFSMNEQVKKKYHLKGGQLLHAYSVTLPEIGRVMAPDPVSFQRILEA